MIPPRIQESSHQQNKNSHSLLSPLSSTVHFFHPSLRSFSLSGLVFSPFSLSCSRFFHFLPHHIHLFIHSKPSCIFSQTRKEPNFRTLLRNNSFSFIGKESNRIPSAAVQILRSLRTRTRSSNGHPFGFLSDIVGTTSFDCSMDTLVKRDLQVAPLRKLDDFILETDRFKVTNDHFCHVSVPLPCLLTLDDILMSFSTHTLSVTAAGLFKPTKVE